MFTETPELYDAIYGSFKDYAKETADIASLIRGVHPTCETILDLACGTGEHAHRLAVDHGFRVDGVDLEPRLLDIARRKHPNGRFWLADMSTFELPNRYDAITCLFSSIGYLRTLDRVEQALRCFRRHLAPNGVVIVEPWLVPSVITDGHVSRNVGETDDVRVERVSRTEVDGRLSRLHFEYHIEDASGHRTATEVHELGLFTRDEMLAAFANAGLTANHDPEGLIGRGLYVARPSTEAAISG
ncbi:MAG TPA: class I SAM-dependent methyltransferase [Gemmatimonadaceae bacterium]